MIPPPRVSVVTATYNRANVLRFSIESLRAQTFADWELLVVGDACTDDTAEVVRSFDDPRIRFLNLPVNSGEQATPNNEGVRQARGEFLAFLNHDDLWTPEHLAVCLDAIGNADFVSTATVVIDAAGRPRVNSGWSAPASSWFLRRTLFDETGPWRPARELLVPPSQDWLFRARRHGVMRTVNVPTVLALHSGVRKNSYAARVWQENAAWAARLADDPQLLARLAAAVVPVDDLAVLPHIRRAAINIVRRLTAAVGLHPNSLYYALRFRRRGGFLDALRKTRGLPPLPRDGEEIA